MAIRFEPMRGLTLAVLICLPILIGLGVWQYQRWQWKTEVLAEIDAAVSAEPLGGIAALVTLDAGSAVDFRRIQVSGSAQGPTWHLYAPEGAIQWQPFREVVSGDDTALVGFPRFDDSAKNRVSDPVMNGARAGYVRRIRPVTGFAKWFGATSNPETNRWFEVNPDGQWLAGVSAYVDLHPTITDAAELPVRRPDIPNNHVSYMLTWWSFAIILLVIYAILHKRAGRLSW